MSNSKAAEQAHKGDDIRESGEVSEVSDVENGQDSANPRQRLGQSDLPAALGDKGKKAKGLKKVKDISELLADMNAKNFEMIQRMVSSVGTKLEQKFSKMFGKASKVTSTVSKPPQDDVDESAAPCKTSDPVTDVDEGDDEVPYYDGDQDGPADQSDPLGLESVQQEDDVLSIFPRDSESFLGDTDFLPKVTKQAKARSLLFAAAKGEQACEKEGVEPPESLDKGKAEMLSKFLDSMSAGAKDKEPVGSQLFAKRFGEAPSFVASKEEPQFQLDQAQVNLINKYWRTKFPDRLAGYSEESYKILKVEEEFVGLTCVPTLDAFVKHVNVQNCEKVTKEGFRNRMWQNFETDLRKIHKGARVGMLAECLNQKILYNVSGLMHRWHESKVLSEEQLAEANQMLLASFDASNRSLEQFSRVGGLTHQVRRKVVLEDIKIPPKNRDAWLKLPLSGDGIMGKAFEENLESMAKMTKEYKASAAQLGYIAARGSKRPGSSAMGPPQKRQNVGNANPSSFHAYRDSGADWSARGRGAFRGRGRSSFRGRGGSNRGSWFSHQTQSTNASAAGPPARGPQWLSQGECGLQTRQSKSAKFSNSQTGGSGRRKVGTFSARVAVSNIRQMGFRGYTAWLRSRVCRYASPVFGYSKDKNAMPKTTQHFATGGSYTLKQAGHRVGSSTDGARRLLQHSLHGAKKELRNAKTSYQPKTIKSISFKEIFQDGSSRSGDEITEGRRLGLVHRSHGCISPCAHPTKPQKVSQVCSRKPLLSISVPTIWSNNSSSGFYQNVECSDAVLEGAGSADHSVSGRFPFVSKSATVSLQQQGHNTASVEQVGIFGEFCKIRTSPVSVSEIHRGAFSIEAGHCVSDTRAVSKDQDFDSGVQLSESNLSSDASQNFGGHGINNSSYEVGSAAHETNSAVPDSFLESKVKRYQGIGTGEQCSAKPLSVVVTGGECSGGSTVTTSTSGSVNNNRCITDRLGGSVFRQSSPGLLVGTGITAAHKSPGDGGSDSSGETVPYGFDGQSNFDSVRQHVSGDLHQQTGGDTFSFPLHESVAIVHGSRAVELQDHSYACGRDSESESRPSVQIQDSGNGVDAESISGPSDFPLSGKTTDRSVCIRSQSCSANFLLMAAKSKCISDRCIQSELDGDVRLCISPNLPDPSDFATVGSAGMHHDSGGSMVAQEVMVHTDSQFVGGVSGDSTGQDRSPETTTGNVLPSQSFPVQIGGLENFQSQTTGGNISVRAKELVGESLRLGSRRDYAAKYRRYNCWCLERGFDSRTAPIEQVVNFLASLEQEGLAYNTICGYRSMLSIYHVHVDGYSVGTHPLVSRLIKGVFNVNPPLKKLCPQWDLQVVLRFLKQGPFVPVELCSLKFLTLKVCFLLAISSARRADDISKLSCRHNKCRFDSDKIVLVPDALLKQDRHSHVGEPIHIEAYEADQDLCIVKLLPLYLQRVAQLRTAESLLVTHVKPHRKPTSQTISRWIVEMIQLAYNDKKLPVDKISGHSTRALAPSWAEFKGVPVSDILRVADWASARTFYKFYWRPLKADLCSSVLSVAEVK